MWPSELEEDGEEEKEVVEVGEHAGEEEEDEVVVVEEKVWDLVLRGVIDDIFRFFGFSFRFDLGGLAVVVVDSSSSSSSR